METEILIEELPQHVRRRPVPPSTGLPPLESGDRLTRCEFERRYEAMPQVKKAELIDGVVYMPPPVHVVSHGMPHSQMMGWLFNYQTATPGVKLADNATLRLDPDNEPQPDAMMWITEAASGHAHITDDDYLEGAPELIVEVAASSASYDLHDKLKVYRRNGVPEYVVWRVYDQQIDWFRLEAEQYVPAPPDAEGVIHSRVLPGLRLAVAAMLNGDLARVLTELGKGLASPEHAAFVERLAGGARSN